MGLMETSSFMKVGELILHYFFIIYSEKKKGINGY